MEDARPQILASRAEDDPYVRRLVEELKAFGTPEEIRELIRQGGSLHDWKERSTIVEEMIEERKWRKRFWASTGKLALWFTGALTIIGALKGLIPEKFWPW